MHQEQVDTRGSNASGTSGYTRKHASGTSRYTKVQCTWYLFTTLPRNNVYTFLGACLFISQQSKLRENTVGEIIQQHYIYYYGILRDIL